MRAERLDELLDEVNDLVTYAENALDDVRAGSFAADSLYRAENACHAARSLIAP